MFQKLIGLHRSQKGITGLETAIILIAFVVVAAVFAYTALSAGLFTTQKSQQAVYSGLEEVRRTCEIKGAIIAKAETPGGSMSQLSFTLANALGGEAIDFTAPTANTTDHSGLAAYGSSNVVAISYVDQEQRVEDLYWTATPLGDADGDFLLEADEKFQITIGADTAGAGAGNLEDALDPDLTANKRFTIEVKTPQGAMLVIERITPPYIDIIMNLN